MARVVHFEIHADDPTRASKFYAAVFGWDFKQWGQTDYWLITTGAPPTPGIDGGLFKRMGRAPAADNPVSAFVCTIDVDNLDDTLKAVAANGGQTVVAKSATPGIGWLAYCKDTEGNIFGLMQADPNAR